MTAKPLTDDQVHDRLVAAAEALEGHGETTRGDTAIRAARRALRLLQFGLVAAMEADSDQVPGLDPAVRD